MNATERGVLVGFAIAIIPVLVGWGLAELSMWMEQGSAAGPRRRQNPATRTQADVAAREAANAESPLRLPGCEAEM